MTVSLILFGLALTAVLSVFLIYPLLVWVIASFWRARTADGPAVDDDSLPFVSMLVVVRNGAAIIDEKLENALGLDYPADRFDVVVFSDGSTDSTETIVGNHVASGRVTLMSSGSEHVGKTTGINRAISACRGTIVVFSDADARLERHALRRLVARFSDASVGGVCGQRLISKDQADLKDAQSRFIEFDSWVKLLESRIGSISSNDGKIYAIRKELFTPVALAVTDDFYSCLSIVRQGWRFVFEPGAIAYIRVPSRSPGHELRRRRRIVCRSLRGIYLMRSLLNPFRFGIYSFGLFINKVVRRALPILLLTMLLTSFYLASHFVFMRWLALLELALLLLAAAHPLLSSVLPKPIKKLTSVAFYFCLGNIGTLMGTIDFLSGKKVTQWNPIKGDAG